MDLTMFHYFMTHERIVFLFHFTPGSNSSIYVWYSLMDVLNIVQRQNMCSSYRGSLRSASLEKLRPGCWKERLRPNIRFCSGCGTADRLFILTVHMCFVFKTAYERVTSSVITSSAKWLKERDGSNEQLLRFSRLDQGRTRTCWGDYISDLTRVRLWILRTSLGRILHMSWQISSCLFSRMTTESQVCPSSSWRWTGDVSGSEPVFSLRSAASVMMISILCL